MYMKSGRYPAEEFKCLYASERMRELIPSDSDRMRHCLMQVCGFAPTRSMLDGALSYLLGWLPEGERAEFEGNFVLFDAEGKGDDEIAEECRRLEVRARRRVYDDCIRLGVPYTGDMPWLDEEPADCADIDMTDSSPCPPSSPSVGPSGDMDSSRSSDMGGGSIGSEPVGADVVAGGNDGDSIQSGLFDSPSADLFREYRIGGMDDGSSADGADSYVPKHMRVG